MLKSLSFDAIMSSITLGSLTAATHQIHPVTNDSKPLQHTAPLVSVSSSLDCKYPIPTLCSITTPRCSVTVSPAVLERVPHPLLSSTSTSITGSVTSSTNTPVTSNLSLKSASFSEVSVVNQSQTTPVRKSTRPRKHSLRCAEFVSQKQPACSNPRRRACIGATTKLVEHSKHTAALKKLEKLNTGKTTRSNSVDNKLISWCRKRGRPKGSRNKKTLSNVARLAEVKQRISDKLLNVEVHQLDDPNLLFAVQSETERIFDKSHHRGISDIQSKTPSSRENISAHRSLRKSRQLPTPGEVEKSKSNKSNSSLGKWRNFRCINLSAGNNLSIKSQDRSSKSVCQSIKFEGKVENRWQLFSSHQERAVADKSRPSFPSLLAAGSSVLGSIGLSSELFSVKSFENNSTMPSFSDLCAGKTIADSPISSSVISRWKMPTSSYLVSVGSTAASVSRVAAQASASRAVMDAVDSCGSEYLYDPMIVKSKPKKKRKKRKSKYCDSSDYFAKTIDPDELETLISSVCQVHLGTCSDDHQAVSQKEDLENVLSSIFKSSCDPRHLASIKCFARFAAERAVVNDALESARNIKSKKPRLRPTLGKSLLGSLLASKQSRPSRKKGLKVQLKATTDTASQKKRGRPSLTVKTSVQAARFCCKYVTVASLNIKNSVQAIETNRTMSSVRAVVAVAIFHKIAISSCTNYHVRSL